MDGVSLLFIGRTLAKVCPEVRWKTKFISNNVVYRAKEIFKLCLRCSQVFYHCL